MSRYGGFVHRIKFGHKIEEEKKEDSDSWYNRARYSDSDSDSSSSDSSSSDSSSSDSDSSSSSDSSWD